MKIKYLGMNLTRYVQDLYEKNYELWWQKSEELQKWRDIPCSWIGGLNTVKTPVLPNLIYRLNAISIKIPASYPENIDKVILKSIWRSKDLE